MKTGSAQRKSVQQYRARMRRSGFRLVQLWIPDTRAKGFAAECARQSKLSAAKRREERAVMEWIEAGRDTEGWTP